MPDQSIQHNLPDDLDEVLVKEPDGTFRVVKVASTAPVVPVSKNTTPGVVSTPGVRAPLPRQEKPAPAAKVLDVDEEKEIAALSEKTPSISPAAKDPTEQLTQRALQESGVNTADPALTNRLTMIMIAYIKNVRNDLETRELLMRPKEQGGVGMTGSEVMRLLSFLKTGGKAPEEKLQVPVPQVQSAAPKPSEQKPSIPLSPPPPPRSSPVAPPLPRPASEIPRPSPMPPAFGGISPSAAARQESKPLMQDVALAPKLTGPVEELRLRLTDWRRMAPTLKDRATKIEEKLRLLEEESYAERLKGVAAWYDSEVIRAYQQIARESLLQVKPIGTICAELQSAGKPTLSEEEFLSVAELNERLRF